MMRTGIRGFATAFALWFAFANGEHGLLKACVTMKDAAHAHHATPHGGAPSAPSSDAANCLAHCCGILGIGPAVTPSLAIRALPWWPSDLEGNSVRPAVSFPYDHPFALGPPTA